MKLVAEGVFGDAQPKWIDFFVESPVEALDELFTNAFYHGSSNVIEPEDLLLDWAAAINSEPFDDFLDSSIAEWIEWRWNRNGSAGESLGLTWQRALRFIALIDTMPHKAINALLLRQPTANNRLGPLVRNRACDPFGWYWASVSRGQADESLVRQWFRLCNLVPGTPVFHGRWGLLGLQRVPDSDEGGFRIRVAQGLKQYLRALETKIKEQSIGQREAERYALGAARDLSRRYPFPNRWREYWSGNSDADLAPLVRRWVITAWGEQVFRQPARSPRKGWPAKRDNAEWAERAQTLGNRLRRSDNKTTRADAEKLLGEQRSYALDTGDSYYVVRTLCRLSFIVSRRDSTVAAAWAEEAIDWEPWNPYCWTALIAAKRAMRDIEEAIRLSFEAIDRFPDDAVARNGLAEVLRQAGRLDEAEAAYRETMDRFPDDAVARSGLAEVLRQAGRLDEAEATYRETMDRFPDNAVARNGLAEVLRQAGRPDEAEATYRETMDRFPDDAVARSGLAEVLRQAGRLDEAEATYRETMDQFPDDKYARTGLTAVLRQTGRPDEAADAYRETIDRFPDDAIARNGLAEVLRQTDRLDEAEATYRETMDQFPDDAIARNGLTAVLRQTGRLDEVTQLGAEGIAPQDAGEVVADADTQLGPTAVTPSNEAETSPENGNQERKNDAAERGTEIYASPPMLRATIRHALLLKGKERQELLQRLITQADELLKANFLDVNALYTKAESLLALDNYAELIELLTSLPQYIAERPDFQTMGARARMARLNASRPQPFNISIVNSVVDSWNAAGGSAAELRGVATIAGLRATATMVDGASLHELQEKSAADTAKLISRQPKSEHMVNFSAWWLTVVRHVITAGTEGEELTYEEIAPRLQQHASLLDTLDGELVDASRYVYAPK